jgi:hypothetical protein
MGEIQKASKEEKMEFFETMKYVSIERFICTNGDILKFIVDSKIVEDIVAHVFFRPDDDLDVLSLEKSMAVFKKVLDTTTLYCIIVKKCETIWIRSRSHFNWFVISLNVCYY